MTKLNSWLCVNRFRSTHVERNAPSVLIHTHLLYAKNRSRSTLVDRIVFPNCSNRFSLYVEICSRLTPVDLNAFPYAQMCSRWTPFDPNAFPMCSKVLSLDARRNKAGFRARPPSRRFLKSAYVRKCSFCIMWNMLIFLIFSNIPECSQRLYLGMKMCWSRSGRKDAQN